MKAYCWSRGNNAADTWHKFFIDATHLLDGVADDALVVGDFAVLENVLQTVLKTLRGANINIVAIHQHMTGENPRMIFLHYYGRGKALALAQGVKSAINTQALAANN